ncbi:MAG: alcohol dehydrogenase catalytic domain-containing protein, partial [Alicyclobacillaceae bacterium]|nr:alcohol dehydrogenase catalytic domain-containing protein [Alicyclobacillaceae bacterium]
MKAAVYEPGKGVWVKDVPDPVPGPDEVLVAVEACGVCGSDRQLVEGEPPPPGTQFPVILGHEIAGRVANAPAASGWATGDPVVVHPFVPCGRCRACRAGQENLCLHQQVVGFQRPGGFAEYVAVPASTLIRRPDGVAPEAAALLVDAFATPYHAITHVAGWQPEQAVVVLGTGGLGLAAVAVLRARGGERVGAVSRRAAGVDAAKAAGAGAG